jgi:hypothetical protein
MNRHIRLVALLLFLAPAAFSADRLTENTFKLSAGEKSPPARLADMRWLAGHREGEAFGGKTEEVWMEPAGPDMAGVTRAQVISGAMIVAVSPRAPCCAVATGGRVRITSRSKMRTADQCSTR